MNAEADILRKIHDEWHIDVSKISMTFERNRAATKPLQFDDQGCLHVRVFGSPENERDTLIRHEGAHVYLFQLEYPPAELSAGTMDYIAEYYATKLETLKYKATTNGLAGFSYVHGPMMDVINQAGGTYSDPRSQAVYECLREISEQIRIDEEALPPTSWKFEQVDKEAIKQSLRDYFQRVFLPQYVPNPSFRFLSCPIKK